MSETTSGSQVYGRLVVDNARKYHLAIKEHKDISQINMARAGYDVLQLVPMISIDGELTPALDSCFVLAFIQQLEIDSSRLSSEDLTEIVARVSQILERASLPSKLDHSGAIDRDSIAAEMFTRAQRICGAKMALLLTVSVHPDLASDLLQFSRVDLAELIVLQPRYGRQCIGDPLRSSEEEKVAEVI
jgi:hypothetical protein